MKNMKTVILAGGMGTRLAEYTELIPKPLVTIGRKPILIHILNIYLKANLKEFIILTGYKSNLIYEYFNNTKTFIKINQQKNKTCFEHKKFKYRINLVYTGYRTQTGLRLKKIQTLFDKNENFFLTYGDGLSNVNLKHLLSFHIKKNSSLTITAVRPPARFGELIFNRQQIKSFEEKNNINAGWINGGFMVVNSSFFKFLTNNNQMLEREPFQKCLKKKKLYAFKHYRFWQCMDNFRDKKLLEKIAKNKKTPWN